MPPPPAAPKLRLSTDVVPIEYRLELTIDPDKTGFSGTQKIQLQLTKRTDHFWLHAHKLNVSQATANLGGKQVPLAKLATSEHDYLGFSFGKTLPKRKVWVTLKFSGDMNTNGQSGLFRQQDQKTWYAYTQFEAISARKAFPCLDEPGFKTPWQITLNVRKDHEAFANAPAVETNASAIPGYKSIVFAKTKPIPSYLVAFAVGPFEIVNGPLGGRNKVPIRIIVPKGKTDMAATALKSVPRYLALLEDYFNIGYPYAKLDNIAVPQFFGAMENPGLITYASRILLTKPEQITEAFERSHAIVVSHELAHQWFGNLVTLAWWDDLWLNESFATWLSMKIATANRPELFAPGGLAIARDDTMDTDGTSRAPALKPPIDTRAALSNIFNSLTYQKGQAVLSMFETWLGEQPFRRGVRHYIQKHAWGNANADDFLAALGTVSKGQVPAAFRTFLDQPGLPVLSVKLACTSGEAPALTFGQSRFIPKGQSTNARPVWHIPLCIRYGVDGVAKRQCLLLDKRRQTLPLQAKQCPDWFIANADGAGYFRVAYDRSTVGKLIKNSELNPIERLQIVLDQYALTRTGTVELGDVLTNLEPLVKSRDRHAIEVAAIIASGVSPLVSKTRKPAYAKLIQRLFGRTARRLGWARTRRDNKQTRDLRARLTPLVARHGNDKALRRTARRLTSKWLRNHSGIDDELLANVLATAATSGRPSLHAKLLVVAKGKHQHHRRAATWALTRFAQPELAKRTAEFLLSGTVGVRVAYRAFSALLAQKATQDIAYTAFRDNFDGLSKQLPEFARGYALGVLGTLCTERAANKVESDFAARATAIQGAKRHLTRSLDRIRGCVAQRKAHAASVDKFLATRR